ncbi:FAD:protein FMN transferase [Bacillus aquiflavi]|uniref:FAD:protein FMN transferase n=1 Tax=Bacillus aquiflavi TaxID=2672567 RepID=A0A6B3VWJ1_9BACI|nr:FAD:protein FMN transferase [Bacillus aquiflavi]MBA4537362.1 FAD:protein FMN transferase [Bacillus aquiflavi]NEY81618.1 FAD:protein FMN transferase [Bacillus aquiflavi]UAC49186.1 FAD:protein FMN transferase [Bacillus aquiflavi]
MDELSLEAMNTTFFVSVCCSTKQKWKTEIVNWFHYIETEWSRFLSGNELYQFNETRKGNWIKVSPSFFLCLQIAEKYRRKTKGLFNPTLSLQMEANGYNKSFPFNLAEKSPHILVPQEEEPFLFDVKNCSIYKQTDQKVDLGGIAKGYAVETAARWLEKNGNCSYGIVDGGGDMKVWSDGEKEWTIGIADPFNVEKEIAQITIKNGAIATSNRVYRSWFDGNSKKHHILNGKTGKPAETNVIQATVISEDCLSAEVGAKLCFLLPSEKLQHQFTEIFPQAGFFIVNEDGERRTLRGGVSVD